MDIAPWRTVEKGDPNSNEFRKQLIAKMFDECAQIPQSIVFQSRHIILFVSCSWYACVLIDKYAVTVGWAKGVVPGVVMIAYGIILDLFGYIIRKYYYLGTHKKNSNDLEEGVSVEVSDDTNTRREISQISNAVDDHLVSEEVQNTLRTSHTDDIPPNRNSTILRSSLYTRNPIHEDKALSETQPTTTIYDVNRNYNLEL